MFRMTDITPEAAVLYDLSWESAGRMLTAALKRVPESWNINYLIWQLAVPYTNSRFKGPRLKVFGGWHL